MKSAFRKLFFFLLLPVTSRPIGRASLLVIAGYLLLAAIFPSPAHAQAPPLAPTCPTNSAPVQTRNAIVDVAIKGSEFDSSVFNADQWLASSDSLWMMLTGCSQIHLSTNIATAGNGALAASGRMVSMLYAAPPASGIQYFANQFQKLNPMKDTYAQTGTVGFTILSPVQTIWTQFRNISYVGFVFVFIVIGFMIMFRAKVSPQTVATVQDSIPRIVIALILVTFSYAIVGLMIDFMFLILNVLITATGISPTDRNYVFKESVFSLGLAIFQPVWGVVANSISSIVDQILNAGEITRVVGWATGNILGIIAGFSVLFMIFRIFIMLLMAYISIIVLTIFSPFILLFQALPGNDGAKSWAKQVAANLGVFVTVALMFILAGIFTGISKLGGTGSTSIIKDTSIGAFPLLYGGFSTGAIGSLIGIGFLFMIPSAAKLVKERIGVKESGAMGAAMGTAMAGGAVVGGAARGAGREFWTSNRSPIGAAREVGRERRQQAALSKANVGIYSPEYRKAVRGERETGGTGGGTGV